MQQRLRLLPLAALIPLAWAGSAFASKPVWPDVVVQLHGAGKAFIIDSKTDAVTATLETCKGGTLGSTTPDAKKVYVSCAGDGQKEVVVIDLAGKSVAKRIETGNRPKHGLVSPNGKWVGVDHWALSDGKLHIAFIDTATDTIAKTLDIAVKGSPKGVTSMHNAWSADSRYFFSMDRVDNRLVVVDTSNWNVHTLDIPSAPHYPVPSPDGKELWLVHEGNLKPGFLGPNGTRLVLGHVPEGNVMPGVIVYDLTKPDMPVIARIDMPIIGEEVVEAHHGNFTQDGKLFMILNRGPGNDSRGRELAFIDAKTKRLVHRVSTASNGIGHAYNSPDGKYAVVTNYGNNVITVVDTKKLASVKDLIIGKGRMGHVAFTRDSKWGYVSNAGDGNVYKVDMNKLDVVKTIETGAGTAGGGQILNVWTNVFEELPR
ncbi:MAG: YncE family protein [Thiobacillaceae bacterium]